MRKQIKVNALSFAHLVKEMFAGQYTLEELAERSGLHYVTVCHYVRELYKVGAVHVSAWRMNKNKQYTVRVYKVGEKVDAPKPRPPMTAQQRATRYRMKLKERESRGQHQPPAL